jgi:hypothetical protein
MVVSLRDNGCQRRFFTLFNLKFGRTKVKFACRHIKIGHSNVDCFSLTRK